MFDKKENEDVLALNKDLGYMVQTIKMVFNFLKENKVKNPNPEMVIDFVQRMYNVFENYRNSIEALKIPASPTELPKDTEPIIIPIEVPVPFKVPHRSKDPKISNPVKVGIDRFEKQNKEWEWGKYKAIWKYRGDHYDSISFTEKGKKAPVFRMQLR